MPENTNTNTYEAMFLFPTAATSDLQGTVDHINSLLERAEAQILSLAKWDEGRLAYEIRGNKRGVYFLVYFKAPGSKMPDLERACNLSERLLRFMIIRADHIPAEQIQAADKQAELADEIRLRGSEESQAGEDERPAAVATTAGGEGESEAQ